MKIEKIKMIEAPVDEVTLNNDSLDALLGGAICGIYRPGSYCHGGYKENGQCNDDPTNGMKCQTYDFK